MYERSGSVPYVHVWEEWQCTICTCMGGVAVCHMYMVSGVDSLASTGLLGGRLVDRVLPLVLGAAGGETVPIALCLSTLTVLPLLLLAVSERETNITFCLRCRCVEGDFKRVATGDNVERYLRNVFAG